MDIFFCDKKTEVDIKHYGSICDKDVFHIKIFIRSIFVPDKVSDKSFHNKPVLAKLLKEVALSIEHILN
jgi:hypothetical protein